MKIVWETIYRSLTVAPPRVALPSPTICSYQNDLASVEIRVGPFQRLEVDSPRCVPVGPLSLPLATRNRNFDGGYLYTAIRVFTEAEDPEESRGLPPDLSKSARTEQIYTAALTAALALQLEGNLFDEMVYRGCEFQEGESSPAPMPFLAKEEAPSVIARLGIVQRVLDAVATGQLTKSRVALAARWYLRALAESPADSMRVLDLWIVLEILIKANLEPLDIARYLSARILPGIPVKTILEALKVRRIARLRGDIVHKGCEHIPESRRALVDWLEQLAEECLRTEMGFEPSGVLQERVSSLV